MKRLLVMVFVMMMVCGGAMAQGGLIGLYIDTWGNECDIDDSSYRIIEVQVVHKFAASASGAQFSIETSAGFTGVYMGEEIPATLPDGGAVGKSFEGIALAYGSCETTPVHIFTIRYLLSGTSSPMSYLEVVDHPTASPQGIHVLDCSVNPAELVPAVGGRAYVNNDGTANCTTTPVQAQTWGAIKALYAE